MCLYIIHSRSNIKFCSRCFVSLSHSLRETLYGIRSPKQCSHFLNTLSVVLLSVQPLKPITHCHFNYFVVVLVVVANAAATTANIIAVVTLDVAAVFDGFFSSSLFSSKVNQYN